MKVYAGNWRRFGTALMLTLVTACAGCGSGGDDETTVDVGDTVVFALRWLGPQSIDLSVRLPNERVVAFDNLSEAGCVLVPIGPPPQGAVIPAGPVMETVTCTAVGPGTYQAFATSNEQVDVAAELDITAPGKAESFAFNVPGNGQTGPFKVEADF